MSHPPQDASIGSTSGIDLQRIRCTLKQQTASRAMRASFSSFSSHVFRFKDTAMPLTLCDPTFWMGIAMFTLGLVLNVYKYDHEDFGVDMASVSQIAATLSSIYIFYIPFYTGNIYERYMEQWKLATTGLGRINDLNVLAPVYLSSSPTLQNQLLRYVNAYQHLIYLQQGGIPKAEQLDICVHRHLLTEGEHEALTKQTCSAAVRVLIWASQTIAESGIDPRYQMQMNEVLLELRRSMAYLWCYDDQPIPLVYSHGLHLATAITVFAASFSNAFLYDLERTAADGQRQGVKWPQLVALLLFQTLYIFILVCLRVISDVLADPFKHAATLVNTIPATRYMDVSVVIDAQLTKFNHIPCALAMPLPARTVSPPPRARAP